MILLKRKEVWQRKIWIYCLVGYISPKSIQGELGNLQDLFYRDTYPCTSPAHRPHLPPKNKFLVTKSTKKEKVKISTLRQRPTKLQHYYPKLPMLAHHALQMMIFHTLVNVVIHPLLQIEELHLNHQHQTIKQ